MELFNNDPEVLEKYSRDASIFKVMPKFVAFPKNAEDIKKLVQYAKDNNESLTVRAAGTDMTGGPLSESIVIDVKNLNKFEIIEPNLGKVEPGVYYRDFEKKALEKGLMLPCYPASKDICALGGMVANNCGGEKSLRYGKMENFLMESRWVFADGNEYVIKPGFIDNEYAKRIHELIIMNYESIQRAKPKVSKNSAGYYLWNVIDSEGKFDLNKLLVGSQGTLAICTEVTVKLAKVKPHHDMIVLFFKSWDELPKVVNAILPFEPESLETFDKETLKLGLKFMPEIAKKAGSGLLSFALKFLPEVFIGTKMGRLPELVVLVEVAEATNTEVKEKVQKILEATKPFHIWSRLIEKDSEEDKFWIVRRESFNLLRKSVEGKKAAPFIEDFSVPPKLVPEFLPQAKKLLLDNNIKVNIAGHAGDGNFHIIPLMDLSQENEREKITRVAGPFYDLVARYHGSITGEHNDGIIRTPYLNKMYSPEILELFKKVKQIFDPQNIFNPGKKVGGSIEYLEKHIQTG